MGWLIAFLFAITTGLLGFLLFVQFDERRRVSASFQQASERLKVLENVEYERSKLQKERDNLARTLRWTPFFGQSGALYKVERH